MDWVSESDVAEILVSVLERRFQEIKSLTEHHKKALHAINRQGRVLRGILPFSLVLDLV